MSYSSNFEEDSSQPADNWAVLVSASKYYFNYRHYGNILNVYELLKEQGFDDDHIIILDTSLTACDKRNPRMGEIRTFFDSSSTSSSSHRNVNTNVIADYKGDEASVESFLRLLSGKYLQSTINSKKLLSSHRSNVLIYLSGHGDIGIFKFRDKEVLTSSQLSSAIVEMKSQKRFNNLLLVADTCKAATLLSPNSMPPFVKNVSFISSSLENEYSYPYVHSTDIGAHIIDKFSLKFTQTIRSYMKRNGGEIAIKSVVEMLKSDYSISTNNLSHVTMTSNRNNINNSNSPGGYNNDDSLVSAFFRYSANRRLWFKTGPHIYSDEFDQGSSNSFLDPVSSFDSVSPDLSSQIDITTSINSKSNIISNISTSSSSNYSSVAGICDIDLFKLSKIWSPQTNRNIYNLNIKSSSHSLSQYLGLSLSYSPPPPISDAQFDAYFSSFKFFFVMFIFIFLCFII